MVNRAKKKKKRRKKNYLLRLIVLIAAVAGLYFLLSSSLFDVQKIKVESNHYYTKEQIISKAEAKTGQNIFAIKTEKMKTLLLEDPYMKNVRIKRSLPGTIIIYIEERKEVAAVLYASTFIIIDGDGLVLRKSDTDPKLTLLAGMTIKSMEAGKLLEIEETSALAETLKILETMEKAELYFKKIDISNPVIKAYIYDQLICQGTSENILESMASEGLKRVLIGLYTNGIERGIINIGSDNYFSFNPKVE